MRLVELFKVACHRPYMIKSILSTRCPHCDRWFSFPTISQQRTQYQDEYANYFAVVNIVVKKMLIIGMICGMSIIVADFEKENNAIGGKEVCHDRKVRFTPK